jgi:hypothetical protein
MDQRVSIEVGRAAGASSVVVVGVVVEGFVGVELR